MSALPAESGHWLNVSDVRYVPKADIGLKETLSCAVRTAREPSLQGSRFHKTGVAADNKRPLQKPGPSLV